MYVEYMSFVYQVVGNTATQVSQDASTFEGSLTDFDSLGPDQQLAVRTAHYID